ncbi:hypothetical protein ACFWM3_19125 [Gottfriedia sp. NPDC058432]|uniref:hypothetical protein n=1 Tax=Gottfriedia sp. NPDC058432 TaxID=3346497 RepID=UPI0036518991
MEFLKIVIDLLNIVYDELKVQVLLANETVEYTSWLTASIFSVLGVFTIFLSHQYQNHTSELTKLFWTMKNNVIKKDEDEFRQNIIDFEYLSKTPSVILNAVNTSLVILKILVPVWIISGISMTLTLLTKKGQVHYLSMMLTLIVTGLFVFFSLKLADIISKLSDSEEEGVQLQNLTDLFNANNLIRKNFPIDIFFSMHTTSWVFLITGDSPFTQIRINNEHGLYNFSTLLFMEATGYEVYISFPVILQHNAKLPKVTNCILEEQARVDIQRFFNCVRIAEIRVSQIILIENKYYYFSCEIEKQNDSLFEVTRLVSKQKMELPTEIKIEFENKKNVFYMNKEY